MPITHIVNENQLDNWVRGNAREAQGVIVELVWRLVCVSCPKPTHRRFPLGDSIGQHGADGELDTATGFPPFIPEGKSHWEIGTNVDAHSKANEDYNSATAAVPAEVRAETTFMFVTPLSGRRDWRDTWKTDGIETWVAERRARGDWKDVVVLDGAQLVDWMLQFPAIGHWLGSLMGIYPEDFDTAESHWNILCEHGAPPKLCADLFTAGRANAGEKLRSLIVERNDTELRFDTRFPRHLRDFISAFVASLSDDERAEHQNRVLIFENEQTFKHACSLNESHVLVADFDLTSESGTQLIQRAKRRHAVVYSSPLGGPPHGNACVLPAPTVNKMKEALIKAGYAEERARILTNRAGRDLSALLRLIQGLSAHPNWATQSRAADLAIAQLIGQWEEENPGDREAVEGVAGNGYGEWIKQIREAAGAQAAPLEFANGRWTFTSRYEPWLYLGNHIGSDALDRFKAVAIKVLSEPDPRLGLPKEQRFAASVYGRKRSYSSRLRTGIAETLALLGAHGEALNSCRTALPQQTAAQVVRELLSAADSHQWASLNDVLPLLAEAAPDEFLSAVGGASEKPDQPFSGVFAEEGDAFFGGSFVTGLLWALESLAWADAYLVRVCNILANLASIDPGGSWANRPANSLVGILLPWYPQTAASADRRHAAVRSIAREFPQVAWSLILKLLPTHHAVGHPSHRPKWRDFVPENWKDGTTNGQRWQDEGYYADLALELAGDDLNRLAELLPYYFYIHPRFSNFVKDYRARLCSPEVLGLSDSQRLPLWTQLTTKISNHRKYSDSDAWRVPEESLRELEEVAAVLKPTQPEVLHRQLFSGHDIDHYDEKGNWEEQRLRLLSKRVFALKEIAQRGGVEALRAFWRSVESPHEVGDACGADDLLAYDDAFIPVLLESDVDADTRFVAAYIWRRFHTKSWSWIGSINRSGWSKAAIAGFFAILPSVKEIWEKAESELGTSDDGEYWKRARIHPDRDNPIGFDHAIRQLIANNRADTALQCFWLGKLWSPPYPELALQALEAFSVGRHRVDTFAIQEVFQQLQKTDKIDEERSALLEWKFLPLLDRHSGRARPLTLYRHMAERPQFFCEVIQLVYRSRHETPKADTCDESAEGPKEVDDAKSAMAQNAYRLLMDWDHPPGSMRDGSFNEDELRRWIKAAKEICTASGHWEVASHHIGQALYYAPRDENELWIEPVCALLDSKEDPEFRQGLSIRIFNSRGVHGFSAGKEELALAEKWERIASNAENEGFSRLGVTLRNISKSYREDAKQSVIAQRYELD